MAIIRFQVLTKDLKGSTLSAPVFYPGSIERTSFAEKNESKGYLILEFETEKPAAIALKRWTFHELPARPMIQLDLHAVGMKGTAIQAWIQSRLFEIPQDSIVKLKVHGKISESAMAVFSAPALRALAPETMNIYATLVDYTYYKNRR
jgi:DNA repair exonuclease SbcCD nuclease subunit